MAVDSPRCQHIALLASDLEIVRSFHRDVLGLELANYLPDEGTDSVRFVGLKHVVLRGCRRHV